MENFSSDPDRRPPDLQGLRKRLKDTVDETPTTTSTSVATTDSHHKKVKHERIDASKKNAEEKEVELLVPATVLPFSPPAAAAATAGGDVEVVGTMNPMRLPQMRQHCTEFPFDEDVQKFCGDCFCYVCDVSASECRNWSEEHCRATDTGARGPYCSIGLCAVRGSRGAGMRPRRRGDSCPTSASSCSQPQ